MGFSINIVVDLEIFSSAFHDEIVTPACRILYIDCPNLSKLASLCVYIKYMWANWI